MRKQGLCQENSFDKFRVFCGKRSYGRKRFHKKQVLRNDKSLFFNTCRDIFYDAVTTLQFIRAALGPMLIEPEFQIPSSL